MTLIDKAEAHDNDLIRRGDALRVADEVFDKCENVNGDDRGAFAAAEVGARIAALPAVTVGVRETVIHRAVLDWIRDDTGAAIKMAITPDQANALTARILAALEPVAAPDPAAIREAANLILQDFDAILTIAGKVTEAANSGRSSTHGVRLGLNALIPKGANHE